MKPQRQFTANPGDPSIDLAGPDALEKDIDNTNKMFDPLDIHDDDSPGGIGTENIQDNAIIDIKIGDRTIDDATSADYNNTGKLTILLSFLAKMIKTITGEVSWFTSPADTIKNIVSRITVNEGNIINHEDRLVNVEIYKADKSNTYTKSEVDSFAQDIGEGVLDNKIETLTKQMAEFASNETGKGASKIGIHDADNNFTATDIEGALSELFTNVSDGKTEIATAITDMGGGATGSDTFSQLGDTIRNLATWDTDLISNNIKKGKNIFGVLGSLEEMKIAQGNILATLQYTDISLPFVPKLVMVYVDTHGDGQLTIVDYYMYVEDNVVKQYGIYPKGGGSYLPKISTYGFRFTYYSSNKIHHWQAYSW